MSYTNVYVPAIVRLDPDSSEKVLVDLLAMPEYTDEVSQELARGYREKPEDVRDRTVRYRPPVGRARRPLAGATRQ